MNEEMYFGGSIREVRERLGWSTYDLARSAGVSQPAVVHWERRERSGAITLATLRRAAAVMDCDFVYRFEPKGGSAPAARKSSAPPKVPVPTKAAPSRSVDPNAIWGG